MVLQVDSWLQNEKSELTMAQKERLWAEKRWQKNMKNMKITTNVFSPSSIIAANKVSFALMILDEIKEKCF